MNQQEQKRIEALESELRLLRERSQKLAIVQNPFWYGIVLADVAAATDPLTGHTSGLAELLISDKAGASVDDLKASGKALPFINRWTELTLTRGTLILFARDWNKSLIVTPGCESEYEASLTLDETGEPL